jgi:hypothetical protein
METLIGFVAGYLVGTKQGRDGLAKARESIDAIRHSAEVRQMLLTGASVAGSAVRQVLGGGAGAVLTGAVEALARKASDAMAGGAEAERAA